MSLIEEISVLEGYLGQFKTYVMAPIEQELAELKTREVFLTKEEQEHREMLIRKNDFFHSIIKSCKQLEELLIVREIAINELVMDIAKYGLLKDGRFRDKLLGKQSEVIDKFLVKIEYDAKRKLFESGGNPEQSAEGSI